MDHHRPRGEGTPIEDRVPEAVTPTLVGIGAFRVWIYGVHAVIRPEFQATARQETEQIDILRSVGCHELNHHGGELPSNCQHKLSPDNRMYVRYRT